MKPKRRGRTKEPVKEKIIHSKSRDESHNNSILISEKSESSMALIQPMIGKKLP
jgi:hypothetical protein